MGHLLVSALPNALARAGEAVSAITIDVSYVPRIKGGSLRVEPREWPDLIGHGVDRVIVTGTEQTITLEGQSLYWLQPVADGWILGGVPYGSHSTASYLLKPDGSIAGVAVEGRLPDLKISQVKLGWWR